MLQKLAQFSCRYLPATIWVSVSIALCLGVAWMRRTERVTNEGPSISDHPPGRSGNEFLAPASAAGSHSEREALASFVVRPGFRVELMAAEPLVYDPVAFAFGADGRLWIADMGDYPFGAPSGIPTTQIQRRNNPVRPLGRIHVLEDTDGDGRFDRSTLFLEVPCPTGVLPWRDGLLISSAPNILYAEDTDNDGKADKQEILYTGFAEGNQQHRVNGLVRGLDNWIYLANGDSGGTVRYVGPKPASRYDSANHLHAVDAVASSAVDIHGRDVRIRPDTGDVEAITGGSQFGRAQDEWGNWFGCNNSNMMWHYVSDEHYQRRNRHLASARVRTDVSEDASNARVFPISSPQPRFNEPHTASRITSACGVNIYSDELFGPEYMGNMFVCEPAQNLVHREVLFPKGVTFKSRRADDERESEFLASADHWFRPTMIQTGPDGALWVADMYRKVIEHPDYIPALFHNGLDVFAGCDKGRLYRVYPTDKTPRLIPRLATLNINGLIDALDSPSRWQRETAQQLLIERLGPQRSNGVDEAVVSASLFALEDQARNNANPFARLHSLCALDGIAHPSASVLLHALSDPHPGIRRHAVRLAESLPKSERTPQLIAALDHLVGDTDPHVTLQLAYTLGEFDGPDASAVLGRVIAKSAHDTILLSAALSSLTSANIESVVAEVLHVSDITAPGNAEIITSLLEQSAAFDNRRACEALLAIVTIPHKGRYHSWQYTAAAAMSDILNRTGQARSILAKLPDEKRPAVLDGLNAMLDCAERSLDDATAVNEDIRVATVGLLGRVRDRRERLLKTFASLLIAANSPDLQSAAVDALVRSDNSAVAGLLLANWANYGPVRRNQVLDVLMSRSMWIDTLFDSIMSQRMSINDIDAPRRQRLFAHPSPRIRERATDLIGKAENVDRQKLIGAYRVGHTHPGDAERGKRVFARACAQCHRMEGIGSNLGPDLLSLSEKGTDELLTAILDPNRAVEAKYLVYAAVTKAGVIVSGLLTSETASAITIREVGGRDHAILRSDLDELICTGKSGMPEGIEKDLSPNDVFDAIAYLTAIIPPQRPKEFPGNTPRLVRAADDYTLHLPAADCEVFGSTLVFERDNNSLCCWNSFDDHAAWRIDVTNAGRYQVRFTWACYRGVAGNPWTLEAGGASLNGETIGTPDWVTYREAPVGEIVLQSGIQNIVLRPGRQPRGSLMNLKLVTLSRVTSGR